jgi:chorismate mutase
MDNAEWVALRAKANQLANDQFASEASDIATLTKKQVSEIIAESGINKETLANLMAVVSDVTKTNQQKAQAIRNINGFAEVAVSLIGKLA